MQLRALWINSSRGKGSSPALTVYLHQNERGTARWIYQWSSGKTASGCPGNIDLFLIKARMCEGNFYARQMMHGAAENCPWKHELHVLGESGHVGREGQRSADRRGLCTGGDPQEGEPGLV